MLPTLHCFRSRLMSRSLQTIRSLQMIPSFQMHRCYR